MTEKKALLDRIDAAWEKVIQVEKGHPISSIKDRKKLVNKYDLYEDVREAYDLYTDICTEYDKYLGKQAAESLQTGDTKNGVLVEEITAADEEIEGCPNLVVTTENYCSFCGKKPIGRLFNSGCAVCSVCYKNWKINMFMLSSQQGKGDLVVKLMREYRLTQKDAKALVKMWGAFK